ncbi:MAG: hypothetical protein KJO07_08705, partial [Deltaproteobacteria bacterium]|nr:hypothetical protein [Deltaproteobacteria bacterium]
MTGARNEPRWPNLIVPGTQKGGTTWLHFTLKRHPQVFMSSPKELFYWGQPGWDTPEARRDYRAHFAIGDEVENVSDDVAYWGE